VFESQLEDAVSLSKSLVVIVSPFGQQKRLIQCAVFWHRTPEISGSYLGSGTGCPKNLS